MTSRQAVLALTLSRQASGRVANGDPVFKSSYLREKDRRGGDGGTKRKVRGGGGDRGEEVRERERERERETDRQTE